MTKKKDLCYLSIVITYRNDNFDVNTLERLHRFIDNLNKQINHYKVNTELIIVEWNPPDDQPKFSDILKINRIGDFMSIRVIVVSPEIHNRFKNADKIALFQMISKNVGIRRAKGQFILATNSDIIFSNKLIKYFAEKKINKKRMYRVERYDVPANLPYFTKIDDLLDYCHNNYYCRYERFAIRNITTGHIKNVHWQLTPKKIAREMIWDLFSPKKNNKPLRIHTNASGDFTLLSANAWTQLKAYPEFTLFAMHIDSLFCYMAHHAGFKEKVLQNPLIIYHIDHAARSDGSERFLNSVTKNQVYENENEFIEVIKSSDIIKLTSQQMYQWALKMRQTRKPCIFNTNNWGLAEEKLPEFRIL